MATPQTNAQPSNKSCGQQCYSCITSADAESSMMYVRVTNILNATFVIFVGIFSIANILNFIHPSFIAICVYLVGFGLLLCCFELRLSYFEDKVKKNFGFMRTFLGRTIFLLFLASFCFRLGNDGLVVSCGVYTTINAFFNGFVMYKHGKALEDPTASYTDGGTVASQFVASRPDLAQQVVGSTMSYAQSNPEVMRAGVNAGVQYAQQNPDVAVNIAAQSVSSQSAEANPFQVNSV